jgi:hypothetical protein
MKTIFTSKNLFTLSFVSLLTISVNAQVNSINPTSKASDYVAITNNKSSFPADKNNTNQFNVSLAANFVSLDAFVKSSNTVTLSWVTGQNVEADNSHFEVEQSFDNTTFKTIGLVLDGFDLGTAEKSFKFKDNSAMLQGKTNVYYRIKQVDVNGNVKYITIIGVKLQTAPQELSAQLIVTGNHNS